MKDNFSQQSTVYAQYRPDYPAGLFDYIMGFVKERGMAWDCGTGNGQSAKVLSHYFEKVIATDISQKQIDSAVKADNIFYVVEGAEHTSITNASVNCITVAQAIHWFDFDKFYAELRRVAKPGAVLAVWTYSLLKISPGVDGIISDYHFNFLKDYWDAERKYVNEHYANIPFPFEEIQTPDFTIELTWSLEDLRGYLNTWSALQKFIKANLFSPVDEVIDKIKPWWGAATQKVIFPVHLRLGIIN